LRKWIVDALVFGAVGSDRWLFVVLGVSRLGRGYLLWASRMGRTQVASSAQARGWVPLNYLYAPSQLP
jgi:hypothetical protein